MKKVFIYTNDVEISLDVKKNLIKKLNEHNIELSNDLTNDLDLIFCIGGDGTLLGLMHRYSFPTIPVCGINVGHLGFFQEVYPDYIDEFLNEFIDNKIKSQPYNIVKATAYTKDKKLELRALNEFAIKRASTHSVHYNISINNSFIEKFSGDGILVCSPAGSTGYNYSLGGSIVDPRLNLLQVTPMSPMNNNAYRALTSSILLPSKDKLIIIPADDESKMVQIQYDSLEIKLENVKKIELNLSNRKINLIRFSDTTFWDVVKGKFL